jgi:hypothetical protein
MLASNSFTAFAACPKRAFTRELATTASQCGVRLADGRERATGRSAMTATSGNHAREFADEVNRVAKSRRLRIQSVNRVFALTLTFKDTDPAINSFCG